MENASEPVINILNSVSTEGGKALPTTSTAVLNKDQRQSISSEHFRNSTQHFLSQLFSSTRRSNRVSRNSSVKHPPTIIKNTVPTVTARRALRAYIVTTDTIRTKDYKYVVYKILVTSGLSQWFVHKRFSEFLELHSHLNKHFPDLAKRLPKLPSKRLFFGKFTSSHINSRKERINKYLLCLIDIPSLHDFDIVRHFFAEETPTINNTPSTPSSLSGTTATQILSQVVQVSEKIKTLSLDSEAPTEENSTLGLFPSLSSEASTQTRHTKRTISVFRNSSRKSITSLRRTYLHDNSHSENHSETSSKNGRSRSRSGSTSSTKTPSIHSISKLSYKSKLTTKRYLKTKVAKQKVSIEDFVLLKVIGTGSYGKVMLARHKGSGLVLAIKAISKKQLLNQPKEVLRVMSERSVLKITLNHPFLVTLRYSFQTTKKLYFCIDYVNGGELFFHIQQEKRFDEERTRFYAGEILLALEYLHSKGIIYRDLKPENCLIDSFGHIRIVDFGMAKDISCVVGGRLFSMCGTPEYLAPEVLKEEGYDLSLDWYCFGAVIYEMLVGSPPYYSRDRSDMFDKILHSKLKFPSTISSEACDLVSKLLDRTPNKRLGSGLNGSQNIKNHPFFQGVDWPSLYLKLVNPPFVPKVTGLFDLGNIDPAFYNLPIPHSIENEGKINAIPAYATERLQSDILELFGGVNNQPQDGPDYNTHFFASGSRFSLSQTRSLVEDTSLIDLSFRNNVNLSNHSDITNDATFSPFQGFSYVCSQLDEV